MDRRTGYPPATIIPPRNVYLPLAWRPPEEEWTAKDIAYTAIVPVSYLFTQLQESTLDTYHREWCRVDPSAYPGEMFYMDGNAYAKDSYVWLRMDYWVHQHPSRKKLEKEYKKAEKEKEQSHGNFNAILMSLEMDAIRCLLSYPW